VPPFRLTPNLTDGLVDREKYGDVWQQVNDHAAIMIQIESAEGLENLDAILTECPEVDAVWIGSLDMRVSMGFPANGGMGGPEPEWQAAVAKYLEISGKHDKPRGGMAIGPDEMFKMQADNLDFIIGSAEVLQLMSLQLDLQRMKEATAYKIKKADTNGAAKEEIKVANGGVQPAEVANGNGTAVAS
jgi:4-hydroxy-2-oxoheptanedioate aldolase